MKKSLSRLARGFFLYLACALISSTIAVSFAQAADEPAAQAPTAETKPAEVKPAEVTAISVVGSGDAVLIEATETVKYTVFKLSDPSRLVIDIPGVEVGKVKGTVKVDNKFVDNVVTSSYTVADKVIGRVEIGLKSGVAHKVRSGENSVLVNLSMETKTAAAPTAPKSEGQASNLVSIESVKQGIETVVRIAADGTIGNYNSFGYGDKGSVVLDIWGVGSAINDKVITIDSPLVEQVRVGEHPDKTRLVFDSKTGEVPAYKVDKSGNALLLTFAKGDGKVQIAKADSTDIVEPKKPYIWIEDVVFKKKNGIARLTVKNSEKARYSLKKSLDGKILSVDIMDATIPERLVRTIDATALSTPVSTISSYQSALSPTGEVRILLRLSQESEFNIIEENNSINIDFPVAGGQAPSGSAYTAKVQEPVASVISEEPAPAPEDEITNAAEETRPQQIVTKPKTYEEMRTAQVVAQSEPIPATDVGGEPKKKVVIKRVVREVEETDEIVADQVKGLDDEGTKAIELEAGKKHYSGVKIDLDMVDADISDILKLIAEISNMNIIASDDVKGTVTMRLKEVPWDQAFDLILMSKDLSSLQVGNVIRVAPTNQIRKEKEDALAARKAREKVEPLVLKYFPINYEEATNLEKHVKEVLSDRGSVTSHVATNTLIVKDIVEKVASAEDVIKNLDKAVPQVLIEARIVEAQSSFARDIGIQWGIDHTRLGNSSHTNMFGSAPQYGQGPHDPAAQTGSSEGGGVYPKEKKDWPIRAGVTNYAVNLPATGTAGTLGALGFVLGKMGSNPMILDLRLSAGEQAGLLKTISRPRITTLDNKEAKIEQGESIPFETISAEGTATTFIDANLSLTVTPQITPDGSVILKIKASRNSVGTFRTSSGEPSINKKEAQTEVLVKDGETTVIGGIVITDTSDSGRGIPYFKNIPVLGWLFKSKSISDSQTELLIFITPSIVKDTLSVG